jgi:hypothetical protein
MRLVQLTALLGIGSLAGAVASSAQSAAPAEDTAARVALFVLRASALGTRGPVERYTMLPSMAGLDETDAIKALIALRKPALCSAWREGTMLWLTCWSHDQIPEPSLIDGATALASEDIGYLKKAAGGKTALKILVQDSRDSLSRLPITDAQYGRFRSEYFVVPASSSGYLAAPNSDADVIVPIGRSGYHRDNSPPPTTAPAP